MTATSATTKRTKAEQALADGFAVAVPALPGDAATTQARRAAMVAFADKGLPTRRAEAWRYTDLRALMTEAYPPGHGGIAGAQVIAEVLAGDMPGLVPGLDAHVVLIVDGALVTSTLPRDLAGVEWLPLAKALEPGAPTWIRAALGAAASLGDSIVELNTAYMSGGLAVRFADGCKPDKPLHVVWLSSGSEPKAVTTRLIVEVGAGAEVTLIESHLTARRQDNAVTQMKVGDRAVVAHVKNAHVQAPSVHLGTWLVEIGEAAVYQPFQLTIGSGLARHSLDVKFGGENARFDLASAFLATDRGHVDTTMVVDHAVPSCVSRELIKGVLDGNARGVFQGKVIVRPGAQKTDGKQMARALLLSPEAEFDSKPELEIHADDVVCGHGSTSMELDEDLLFYCRSRGIPEVEARLLLVESFTGEALDRIGHEALREGLRDMVRAWLRRPAA